MIVFDNYSTVDEKILLDDISFSIRVVDDRYPEESIGVGCTIDQVFYGVYIKEKMLHFCYQNRIYSERSDMIRCWNKAISQNTRHFFLSFSGKVICDFDYKRDKNPIPAFGDDEEDNDFFLYLSTLLKSKASIDRFVNSMR